MYLTRVVNGKFRFLVTPPAAVVTDVPAHAVGRCSKPYQTHVKSAWN